MVAGWLGSRCLAAQLLTAQSAGRWPSRHIPELHTIPRVPAAAAVRMEAADLLLEIDEAAWSGVPIRPADLSRVAGLRFRGIWELRLHRIRGAQRGSAPHRCCFPTRGRSEGQLVRGAKACTGRPSPLNSYLCRTRGRGAPRTEWDARAREGNRCRTRVLTGLMQPADTGRAAQLLEPAAGRGVGKPSLKARYGLWADTLPRGSAVRVRCRPCPAAASCSWSRPTGRRPGARRRARAPSQGRSGSQRP